MKDSKNLIWLLLDSRQFGGIESHVFQLADGLNSYNENIAVVFINDYGNHPLHTSLEDQSINFICLDGKFHSLIQAINKYRPTIIHTHGYKAGIMGRLSGLLLKLPVVSTYHAGEISTGRLAFYDWIDRKTAYLSKCVYAVSPQICDRIPVASKLVKNFINTTALKKSMGNQIAFVGRLSHEKGADYLLSLASLLPDSSFHIYGDGPDKSRLESTAPSNVVFHGQQSNMINVWKNIGLLVMPSRFEGLPMAALEAMGRGIPVIASRVGYLDHLIEDDINGWLVNVGDLLTMKQRIEKWQLASSDQKNIIKQAAQKTIDNQFSSQKIIPELVRTYCTLIQ